MSEPKTERFRVEAYDEEWRSGFRLIDTQTGEEVGRDGGEPEDQSLVRDWAWVPERLNAAESELERRRGQVRALTEALKKAKPFVTGYALGSEKNAAWLDAALSIAAAGERGT